MFRARSNGNVGTPYSIGMWGHHTQFGTGKRKMSPDSNGELMKTFVVREKVDGVLVPLPKLMGKLPFLKADIWVFRDIQLQYGSPFGLSISEFEKRTRQTPNGFRVTATEFRRFLCTDFQIIDGYIEGVDVDQEASDDWLFQIECFDASEWDISVKSSHLAAALERVEGIEEKAH
jgi:hypothetical protein